MIFLVVASFWIHVICGLIHLYSIPGSEFLHISKFGKYGKVTFGYAPRLWFILSIETTRVVDPAFLPVFLAVILIIAEVLRICAKIVRNTEKMFLHTHLFDKMDAQFCS